MRYLRSAASPGIPAFVPVPAGAPAHPVGLALALALTLALTASPVRASGAGAPAVPPPTAAAQHPDGHALHPPAGIRGGHTLQRGGIALGYAYQRDHHLGLRDGTRSQGADQVRLQDGFDSAPSRFDVERHEVALMLAPLRRVTLMAMLPILRMEMRNVETSGAFVTRSDGVGDLELSVITRFMEYGPQTLYFGLQLGVPTGSIHRRDTTPSGDQRLPYPMQPGAGSWHLQPTLSYETHEGPSTWGAQLSARFHLDENAIGYRLGPRYFISGWAARRVTPWLSGSLRLEWSRWGNVRGADPLLDRLSSPVADPKRQAGQRIDVGAGIDVKLPFTGPSLALEAVLPLLQDLDGPQVDLEWQLRAGLRWSL